MKGINKKVQGIDLVDITETNVVGLVAPTGAAFPIDRVVYFDSETEVIVHLKKGEVKHLTTWGKIDIVVGKAKNVNCTEKKISGKEAARRKKAKKSEIDSALRIKMKGGNNKKN